MSSDRKIRASQLNGAKSHGPVTPEGLRKSSANSARHHLLTKTILLENERPHAFAELVAGLTNDFNPQTETQRALVENMAVSRWRQMRVWALERATIQSAMDAHDSDKSEPAERAADAFRSLADTSRTLDLLNRYETRFDRQFSRSLNLLIKLAAPDCPLNKTALPACSPSADFCQTNLIPILDTDSGAGLPACASPDNEDPQLTDDAPTDSHLPSSAPESNEKDDQPAPDSQPLTSASEASLPAPALLAHFPTFVFDDAPSVNAAPDPEVPPNRLTAAAHLTSILNLR
jgi:hypothetical protein